MLQFMFDTACLSETYLDSSIASDDGNLEMLRYNLIRSDYPSDGKHGVNIHYLQESIPFELKTGDKLCNFISLRTSPESDTK